MSHFRLEGYQRLSKQITMSYCKLAGCTTFVGNWQLYCDNHSEAEIDRSMYVPRAWSDKGIPTVEYEQLSEGTTIRYKQESGITNIGEIVAVNKDTVNVEYTQPIEKVETHIPKDHITAIVE